MKTRRFIIYSVIYIVLIWAFVYSLFEQNYNLELLGYSLELPIALWVIAPLIIFAVLTILHILYHGFLFCSYKRRVKKDSQIYSELAKNVLLGIKLDESFKTELFSTPCEVTKALSPWKIFKDQKLQNTELESIVKTIQDIKNGEVVDIKKYRLPRENPLHLQNELNKINNLSGYCLEVLKNDNANDMLKQHAYKKLLKDGTYLQIKRILLDKKDTQDTMQILQRFKQKDIELSPDEIFELLNNINLGEQLYLKSAIMLKNTLKPDAYMSIFEKLKNNHQDAEEAYMLVIYELEMIDKLREILQSSNPDEYIKFKLLLFLRDSNKASSSTLFFND